MNSDKIEFRLKLRTVDDWCERLVGRELLEIDVLLNGALVEWSYVDIYSLMYHAMDHKSSWAGSDWSCFTPFTCSCGVSGCAGVHDGIYVKLRKYSVEWRASKDDGYGFLSKSFFSFDRRHYEKQLRNLYMILYMNANDFDTGDRLLDLGHYEGGETTVDQFLNDWRASK